MKKIVKKIVFIAFLISTSILYAQAPEAFNYQAAIRDGAGEIVANTNVNLRISIVDTDPLGTTQYRETVDLTTNQFGLVNHAIGNGSVELGTFQDITWGSGNKFLKVEVSINGAPYNNMGTQQILSVPFALEAQHAQSADNAINATNATNADFATSATSANNSTTTSQIISITSVLNQEQTNGNNTGFGLFTHNLNISQFDWSAVATYVDGGQANSCYAEASTQWVNPNQCRIYIKGSQCPGLKRIRLTVFRP